MWIYPWFVEKCSLPTFYPGNWAKQMLILNKNKLTFILLLESQQGYFKRSFILSLFDVFRVSWPSSTAQINLWIICLGIYSEHLFLYAYKTLASKHTHHSWKLGTEFLYFCKYYKVRGLRYTGRFCWSLLTHIHVHCTHTHTHTFVQFKNVSQKGKKVNYVPVGFVFLGNWVRKKINAFIQL